MPSKLFNYSLVTSVVLVGLFAGVLLAAAIAISPSLALLDASNYTLVKQAQIRVLQVAMSVISTVYTLLTLYILWFAKKYGLKQLFNLCLIALLLVILALVYSAFTDIPYNQMILKWDVVNPPAHWADIRNKWDVANQIRTIPSVLAFILQTFALFLISPNKNRK